MSDYRNCFWPDPCKPVCPPSTPCYPPCPPAPAPCPPAPPCCPPVNNPLCVNCGGCNPGSVWVPSYAFRYTTLAAPETVTKAANPSPNPPITGLLTGPATSDITTSTSGVTFTKGGTYAVWYSVSLDTTAAPTPGLVVGLTLDGALVAGSSFTTVANDYNYTKMAIVSVAAGQSLAIALTSPGSIVVTQASLLVEKIAS